MIMLVLKSLILFCICLMLSCVVTFLMLKSSLIKYFKDKPGSRKVHQRIIPRIGGVIVLILFTIVLIVWKFTNIFPFSLPQNLLSTLLFVSISILLIGLPDDLVIYQIHNKAKFLGEVLIALEIVLIMGVCLNEVHFLGYDIELGFWGVPISVIWLVGVTNAVNIVDGVDGLAGAVVLTGFVAIGLIAGIYENYSVLILSLILGGLIAGFMIFNLLPACVFLGDTGALLLGMIYGVLSIYLISDINNSLPVLVTPLIVGFPVVDTFSAMGRRFSRSIINGKGLLCSFKRMSIADNEHIHHRLIYRGLTHNKTVIILTVYQMITCMAAIVVIFKGKSESIMTLTVLLVTTIWILYKLDYYEPFFRRIKRFRIKQLPEKNKVGIIADDDVFNYSIMRYNQNSFEFIHMEKIGNNAKDNLDAIILQSNKSGMLNDLIVIAGSLYLEKNCPVLIIVSSNDTVPEQYRGVYENMSIIIIKAPVYVPVLFTELKRITRGKNLNLKKKNSGTVCQVK